MLVIGYYTKDTPYEDEFKAFEYSLKAHDLEYEYLAVDSRGTWQKNTQMKAEVFSHFIEKYPGKRMCYIDVDSIIISYPSLLWTIDADMAAVIYGGVELLSGVVMFVSNQDTKDTVEYWQKLNKKYPTTLPNGRPAWDQRTLYMAIKEMGIKFAELPPAYNFIADLSVRRYPGVNPVILATRGASRLKHVIDRKV